MWQPFQPSTSPDLPGKKSTMQYLQKDRPLYIVMHIKDARTKNPRRQQPTFPGQYTSPQARRVRHVKPEITHEESTEESVDAEAALYIKELHEDWANINSVRPTEFRKQSNDNLKKNSDGEFWVETLTMQEKLHWLADTGSPRSFINTEKAMELSEKVPNATTHPYKEFTKYRCFNNNNIQIRGVLH